MVLPFLEHEVLYPVGMEALQRILRIDSDALYRHLMTLCHQPIPAAPRFGELQQPKSSPAGLAGASTDPSPPLGRMELAARSLLDFIDTLLEQSFD
jgi:hypothetical protein